MGFRTGLLLGGAIGYVFGTKAGRDRYETIRSGYQTVKRSRPAQKVGTEARHLANQAGHALESTAAKGVDRVTEMVRSGDATSTPTGAGRGRNPT